MKNLLKCKICIISAVKYTQNKSSPSFTIKEALKYLHTKSTKSL